MITVEIAQNLINNWKRGLLSVEMIKNEIQIHGITPLAYKWLNNWIDID